MSIVVRPAILSDVSAMIPLIKMASGGLSEFLLDDIVTDVPADFFIEMALTDENTTYYYPHLMVAESAQTIIGASNYYPAELHGLPDIMRSFITKEKLDILQPYFNSRVEQSLYINTLAILPEYRHTACGLILAKKIEQVAREKNRRCLSAHVWVGHTELHSAMKMAGYEEVEHLDITHPGLFYEGGMVLLKGPDL